MAGAARADGPTGGDARADGRIGVQLLEAPADRRTDPRAQMYVIDHLRPGATITRRVRVSSTSSTKQYLWLYAGAAFVRGAKFNFTNGRTPNELTTWTSFDRPFVTLRPHGSAIVKATIRVPWWASKGERYAVLWAEDSARRDGRAVRMVNRVGVRMYIDVGKGGEPASDFKIDQLVPARTAQGRPEITATVRNTGGRALDLGGTLTLGDGPGGLRAGPFKVPQGLSVEPGGVAKFRIPLDPALPNGPWTVSLKIGSGLTHRSLDGRITFPERGEGQRLVAARLLSGATPAVVGLGAVAVLAGLVLTWAAARRIAARR